MRKRNPGAGWHEEQYNESKNNLRRETTEFGKGLILGAVNAHEQSRLESKKLGMRNPRRRVSRRAPKLSKLILPALIVGGIVWWANKK